MGKIQNNPLLELVQKDNLSTVYAVEAPAYWHTYEGVTRREFGEMGLTIELRQHTEIDKSKKKVIKFLGMCEYHKHHVWAEKKAHELAMRDHVVVIFPQTGPIKIYTRFGNVKLE